jgi:hypothetical protein
MLDVGNKSDGDASIIKKGVDFLMNRKQQEKKATRASRFDPDLEQYRIITPEKAQEMEMVTIGRGSDNDMAVETGSNTSRGSRGTSVVKTAKNLLGIGEGSRFNPIKASVVMDDSDEEEEKQSDDNHFDILHGLSEEEIIHSGPARVNDLVKTVVEELDELIDIDREQ